LVVTANVACDLVTTATAWPRAESLWFEDGDAFWTYGRLLAEASTVTTWLHDSGVDVGDRVALLMGSWPEHVAAWYGILAAGAVVVDINYIVPDEEWQFILEDCEPAAVVVGEPFESRVRTILQIIGDVPVLVADACGAGWSASEAARAWQPEHRNSDDLAVLCYTSGTTGEPKGVMHTHGLIGCQLQLLAEAQDYRAGDVVYQSVPLFAIQGYLPTVASVVRAGGALVLTDRFDAMGLARASRRFDITYLTLSAPMLQAIMSLPEDQRPEFPKLRLLTVGGAPLQPEVRSRFEALLGVPVSQGFGMTEIMGVMVVDYAGDAPWGSCGRVWPTGSGDLVVIDDDGVRLGAGEIGEFAVHRRRALAGYWRRPDLYEESFSGDWFRTGDIGMIDVHGYFYVLDRKKDMIIRGGFNIYSAEIERVLSEHPDVAEATVVGAPDERLGEVPVAFVVPRHASEDGDALADELIRQSRDRLGSLKTPVWIRVVHADELPRNALRKVRKRDLRDSLRASQ
jgi:long-chain acyl-CoA synthetase